MTDGIDVTSSYLGRAFPDDLRVAMNSAGRNFLFYRWGDVAAAASPPLAVARRPGAVGGRN